jgi:hypothetical protein
MRDMHYESNAFRLERSSSNIQRPGELRQREVGDCTRSPLKKRSIKPGNDNTPRLHQWKSVLNQQKYTVIQLN